jgi:crossover junction endodeoxyribonuclease RuvC
MPLVRVLGVDPGLTRCGLGVVDGRPGKAVMVAVGVVRTPSNGDPGERLVYLERELDAWLARYEPEVMAVERVFADTNITTVMGTAHATAVALLTATKRGIPVVFHTPTEVKAAVTGSGRADKAQVTAMVTRILGLEVAPRPSDAADALALAICHAWRGAQLARLESLAAQARR